jgi:hypothetical protein
LAFDSGMLFDFLETCCPNRPFDSLMTLNHGRPFNFTWGLDLGTSVMAFGASFMELDASNEVLIASVEALDASTDAFDISTMALDAFAGAFGHCNLYDPDT